MLTSGSFEWGRVRVSETGGEGARWKTPNGRITDRWERHRLPLQGEGIRILPNIMRGRFHLGPKAYDTVRRGRKESTTEVCGAATFIL